MIRYLLSLAVALLLGANSYAGPVQQQHLSILGMYDAASSTPAYTDDMYLTFEGANATARATASVDNRGGTLAGEYVSISDCSSAQHHSGSYSLAIGDDDEAIRYAISSGRWRSSVGYISVWVYIDNAPAGNASPIISTYSTGAYNIFALYIETTRAATLRIQDSTSNELSISTAALSLDEWHQVEARWSMTTDNYGIRVDGGSWTSDTTALGSFGTENANLYIGDIGLGPLGGDIFVDDMQIWVTYDQS